MKTKFNLDRQRLDSSHIQSRQNFDKVIKGYRAMKPPIWKNPWFYGPAGLASLALLLTLTFQNTIFANDNNSTLITQNQSDNKEIPEDTPCIKAPLGKSDIAFEYFTVDPQKGGEIITKNGSIITFPKKSIVAPNKGLVSIKVREFPDAASAFVAGIPMDYQQKSAFESGGMIEVRGEQNGKSISINSKAPFQVNMTLTKSGDDFKFWSLNDKNGAWSEYPCDFVSKTNSAKVHQSKKIEIKGHITATNDKIEICEKDIQLLIKQKINTEFLPQANARKLIVDFDAKQFPELAAYKELEFEYVYPKNQSSAEVSAFEKRVKYATSTTWNDMNIQKNNGNYIVTFKNSRESYSLPVRPVLKGKSLDEFEQKILEAETARKEQIALKETEKKYLLALKSNLQIQYDALLKSIKQDLNAFSGESNDLPMQRSASNETASTIRSAGANFNGTRSNFITAQFGVFNCDRPFPYPKPFPNEFICKNEFGQNIEIVSAYLFDLKQDVRFTYGAPNGRSVADIAWNKNPSVLLLIDTKGSVYFLKDINQVKLNGEPILFKQLERKNVNLDEIKKILGETSVSA